MVKASMDLEEKTTVIVRTHRRMWLLERFRESLKPGDTDKKPAHICGSTAVQWATQFQAVSGARHSLGRRAPIEPVGFAACIPGMPLQRVAARN